MRQYLLLFILITTCGKIAVAQSPTDDIEAHRKMQHEKFVDSLQSPLTRADREHFTGLNYYPIDLKFRVTAKFVRAQNTDFFAMKTTTSRRPMYRKYGEVHFTLDSVPYKLEVYENPDVMKKPGYEDYLFLPFTDKTNGEETYDVGRYIDFRIPQGDEVVIDFNKSYNPYCSYSPNYSCPIPPAANDLPIAVTAGEKTYKDH